MKLRTDALLRLKRALAILGFISFGVSVLWPALRRLPEGQRSEGQRSEGQRSEGQEHLTSDF